MPTTFDSELYRINNLAHHYTDRVGIDASKDLLSDSEGRKLFEQIVVDYVDGKICVDDLSFLCEQFYGKFSPYSDIHSILLMGAEIEWYIRHKPHVAADCTVDLIREFAPEALEK